MPTIEQITRPNDDPVERDHGRNFQEMGRHVAADDAQHDADHAANFAEHDRFHDELRHDVSLLGADGAADADFAGPLRDRDEHDVHDADAGGEQRNRADHGHADAHGQVKVLNWVMIESLEKISKSSSFAGRHLAGDAQDAADLLDGVVIAGLRRAPGPGCSGSGSSGRSGSGRW